MKQRIVVDADTGVDDALALTVAFHWPDVHVEAITCVGGNTGLDNVVRNTLSVVKVNQSPVPIHPGGKHSLLRRLKAQKDEQIGSAEAVHSANGFGGVSLDLSEKDWKLVQKEHAASALCRLARDNKNELTVVTLAPMTNIALAMRLDPEFSSNLKEIVVMGGNYLEPATEVGGAEFNFFVDAEAANIVLSEAQCPVTIVPFDTCERSSPIPWEWFQNVVASPSVPAHGKLMGSIMKAFSSAWPCFDPCDAVAMVAALDRNSVITVDNHKFLGVNTRGEPYGNEGYGCLIHERNGRNEALREICSTSAQRAVVHRICTEEIKKRIEYCILHDL